uniref:Uncharacterized protein n=1 Tax=Strigamia maritima TaxID=126957 RepID=T1JID5_STRMM
MDSMTRSNSFQFPKQSCADWRIKPRDSRSHIGINPAPTAEKIKRRSGSGFIATSIDFTHLAGLDGNIVSKLENINLGKLDLGEEVTKIVFMKPLQLDVRPIFLHYKEEELMVPTVKAFDVTSMKFENLENNRTLRSTEFNICLYISMLVDNSYKQFAVVDLETDGVRTNVMICDVNIPPVETVITLAEITVTDPAFYMVAGYVALPRLFLMLTPGGRFPETELQLLPNNVAFVCPRRTTTWQGLFYSGYFIQIVLLLTYQHHDDIVGNQQQHEEVNRPLERLFSMRSGDGEHDLESSEHFGLMSNDAIAAAGDSYRLHYHFAMQINNAC